MLRGLLLALAALAACSKPLPPGVKRVEGASGQAFAWSPASRRLAYVEGRFPDRTFLVILNRASGARTKRRLKGFVLGAGTALSRDGGIVLLDAGKVGRHDTRNEPANRVILAVDANSGNILSETPLHGAAAALGHPAWSPYPVAVYNDKKNIVWRAFGAETSSGVVHGPPAWRALLLDEPYLIVAEKQTQRPRMAVYDLRNGSQVAEWRVALSGAPLALRPDGTALSARWMSETGQFVLESGDPKTGRRVPLFESEGEIESAVETDSGLFAVAKDPTRRNDTGKSFLAPRTLLVAENNGRQWSVPWTHHQGKFIGSDPANGRLLFAVTDQDKPILWEIAPTRAALAAAGPAIDGQ